MQILTTKGTVKSSFTVDTANDAGGAKIAVADLGHDGVPEIIVGNGLGNEPRVTVYRTDGSTITSFLAYGADMGLGVTLAACDANGDGANDIVTGTQYGATPHVRTFDTTGKPIDAGFFAYSESFKGGVNITCGDLDGDGKPELITSPGPTGGPEVKTWKFTDGAWKMDQDFFAFAPEETGGVVTTISDGKLFVTLQRTSGNHIIKSYVIHSGVQEVGEQENHTIHTDALFSVDGQIVASGTDGGYIADDTINFSVNVPHGAVDATAADVDGDGTTEIITIPDRPLFNNETDPKSIDVDLSEQRLYAYENGVLANTFYVSTAKAPFTTPTGTTKVLAKLPIVVYNWSYGPGDPRNYNLGPTPWNLRIYDHIYIHYAYWHNNFGHPMSHGCVNVNLTNIKWIYNWAQVGTPVTITE